MLPKVAWKPVGGVNTASSRLRAYLPCQYLRENGWDCEIYKPEHKGKYDIVVFQKCYAEEDIVLVKELKKDGTITVFDLCDNHFYNPTGSPVLAARAERLREVIEQSDTITVSTAEIGKLIPGRKITVIDDTVDTVTYDALKMARLQWRTRAKKFFNPVFDIVWFGTAGSETPRFGMVDLTRITGGLERLNKRLPVRLTVISNSREAYAKYLTGFAFPTRYYEWQRDTFPYLFSVQDVCIIPIDANPFTICKTSNRLITALQLGLPVVADRIPSYEAFAGCTKTGEWEENLYQYARHKSERKKDVKNGQRFIQSRFSKEVIAAQWIDFLKRTFSEKKGKAGKG